MMLKRGMGVTANPVFGDISTQPNAVGARGSAGISSLPWFCFIPGYAMLSESSASQCNVFGATPNPPVPVAPAPPAGSLDVNQNPAGAPYSVDQVISNTAAAQRQQVQDFFTEVADQSAGTAASAFPWGTLAIIALVGGGVYVLGRRSHG